MSSTITQSRRRGRKPRAALKESDITGLKYLRAIRRVLKRLHSHKDCPNRKLHYDQYASLLLLYFLNPVLTSLRGLRQATTLRNVQRRLGMRRSSLGSLCEASHVFDPELLAQIVQELAGRACAVDAPPQPKGLPKELDIVAVDATLLKALPRMVWATWLDDEHRAAKMHLEYDIIKGIPESARLSDANTDEKAVLKKRLESGKLYILDGAFAQYSFLEAILEAGSSFVGRLRENAVYQTVEQKGLTEADRAAGVVFDRVVWLGCQSKRGELSRPVRVVKVHVKSPAQRGLARRRSRVSSKKTFRHRPKEYDLLIVTDRMDVPAETVATLYRLRWTIELFFRWFKCVLRFKHLLCESQGGVEILVYCALIVSLLITLWTGRKPTKRTLEMIQLYFQGWAQLDELEAHIAELKRIDQ